MKAQSPDSYPKLEELEYIHRVLNAELSFHEFLKQAWSFIEGEKEYVDGWHIQAICEHLEALANRKIKNLLINIPPRCGKSTIISVAFPAWRWLHAPHERFLYASYALSLALRDSVKCRRLIQSPWYQERWGYLYKLEGDQNTKGRFDNTYKGYRISTSSGSAATGEGGSILITDDPNNALDVTSHVQRERRIDWWRNVWTTRLNDKKNDCRLVVQQRVHERDTSGLILEEDETNDWEKLILPMKFEEKRKSITIVLPTTEGEKWEDPRQKDGQLLWPEKIGQKEVDGYEQELGAYAFAAQYQQRPSPAGGGIIKKDWFQWWKDTTPPQIEFVMQSWDTAFTAKEMSAYSACTTWGIFYDHNYIENLILLSVWRDRVEYPELREMAKRLYFDYRDTGKERNPVFKGRPVDMCLIEGKASGDPLIQDLNIAGIRAIPFNPNKYISTKNKYREQAKINRTRLITPLIEGGRVWLPARPPNYNRLLPFADTFLESVICFPNAEANDLVDTMTQALLKLKEGKFLLNPKDERPTQPSTKEIKVY